MQRERETGIKITKMNIIAFYICKYIELVCEIINYTGKNTVCEMLFLLLLEPQWGVSSCYGYLEM